ncbi:MutS-like protein [Anseongella ginsenosidimutans]|uniref:MutS-like protein n=1 Tax=Anseongella ginsenosidimutans TaxID=496056 RepID=A0A4R3KVI5_9SPHI|nr:hypothetical protein [Anseongella ginsenosidimutans]QEC51748.1 hypothetical protein FRZ59_04935 [Anseongella ginsenosidimutans]TCS89111.1 MutS-like protein [Anseongella ginsenosidimutans]
MQESRKPESSSSVYQSRGEKFAGEEFNFGKKARWYAALRLLTAIVVLAAGWQAIADPHWLWLFVTFTGIILFAFLVRRHARYRQQQGYFGRLKIINEKEAAALNGQRDVFPEGNAYANAAHPYTYDLDIFGKNSIFQLVNRTACLSGEALLAGTLTSVPSGIPVIRERQEAIAELAPLIDFRQHFMAKGQGFNETQQETRQLYDWLSASRSSLNTPFLRIMRYVLPAIALLLFILALAGQLAHTYWVLMVLFNLAVTGLFLKQVNRIHAVLSRKHLLLEKFSFLLEHMGKQEFSNQTLKSLRQEGLEAFEAIRRLTKLLNFFDQRLNLMIGAVLNGFFLSDIHCVIALDSWRLRYRERMPHWLDTIFRCDELNSFANFAFNHPSYCYPQFHEKSFFEAEELGHPLIAGHDCVPNDFSPGQDKKVVILTGANMSGKSTFLRSIGVNLVLACAGAPVFARKFNCCLAGIYTSMRVSDSLSEDTSYFYAELKRLSMVMDQLRAGKKLFILLDEILKGTNSADKLYGSTGLVEEFIHHDCLCIIATHDLDLGKLEEKHPARVSNYCFESTLEKNELHFDYTLRKGIARNKNATFLMQKTGLIK